MSNRKLSLLLVTLLALVLALAACGEQQGQPGGGVGPEGGGAPPPPEGEQQTGGGQTSTLEEAKSAGYIRVGFANEVPYAYAKPDGTLAGEAVDVAREVFKQLGIEQMDGVVTEFGSLIPGLNAGRFDVVTAGMFIKPERCEQVLFANPEYQIGEGLLVKAGNPHDLHSYEDIANKPEVKLGIMGGAYEYDYATASGVPEGQIVTVPDNPAGLDALLAGRIDALTATGPSLQALLDTANTDQVERVKDFKQPVIDGESVVGYGAAAFRQADTEFRDAFNQELAKLKESGKLLELIRPYGFTEENLPGDETAEQLCQG